MQMLPDPKAKAGNYIYGPDIYDMMPEGRPPYHLLSPELQEQFLKNLKDLKEELYHVPLKIIEMGSFLIGKTFDEVFRCHELVRRIKMLWVRYCILEDLIAMEYEYRFRTDKPDIQVNVEYNSWPQFRRRPVLGIEPHARYPELRKITLTLDSPNAPPEGFDDIVPGRSWAQEKNGYNWIITSFVSKNYFEPNVFSHFNDEVCISGALSNVRFRRQSNWSWGQVPQIRPSGNRQPPLVRPPVTQSPQLPSVDPIEDNAFPDVVVATPPPPQLAACLARCLTTPEYNPVCGSDGNTYHNRQRLVCQNSCTTEDIRFERFGTCAAL